MNMLPYEQKNVKNINKLNKKYNFSTTQNSKIMTVTNNGKRLKGDRIRRGLETFLKIVNMAEMGKNSVWIKQIKSIVF